MTIGSSIAKVHILTIVLAVVGASTGVAETVRGSVFNDTNRNGIRETGEPGIGDVGISNGAVVVQTDRGGGYTIDIEPEDILFVIKPSQWQVALDEKTHLPRHFYVHRPGGSPPSKFPGIPPTGPLPDAVDFALVPNDEEGPFTVLCFGDTQPRDQREVDFISHDILEELIGTDAAFGMTLGDIVFDNLAMLPEIAGGVGTLGIPWHHVIGNPRHKLRHARLPARGRNIHPRNRPAVLQF